MIGNTTHYFCEHNLRVQVSPFMYICLDTLYNYITHRDIMHMYTINKLLLLLDPTLPLRPVEIEFENNRCCL